MTIAHRIAVALGGKQPQERPRLADMAQTIAHQSRLMRVAECLEREMRHRQWTTGEEPASPFAERPRA